MPARIGQQIESRDCCGDGRVRLQDDGDRRDDAGIIADEKERRDVCAAAADRLGDQAEQVLLGEGLHQVLKGAELHRRRHRLGLTETTNQNHVKARIDRLDFGEHLQAVDAWHEQVE